MSTSVLTCIGVRGRRGADTVVGAALALFLIEHHQLDGETIRMDAAEMRRSDPTAERRWVRMLPRIAESAEPAWSVSRSARTSSAVLCGAFVTGECPTRVNATVDGRRHLTWQDEVGRGGGATQQC
jgi:hypothetical protein